jgi:hypothetical protein
MNLASTDRRKLGMLLDQLTGAVEELLLAGLTTASEATRQTLGVAFQEASRLRLLRLGSTLRGANDELGRFTRNEPEFSPKRLSFFLNRSWLLGKGLGHALQANDDKAFDRLLWTPANQPVDKLEVVTLGVSKKVAKGGFVAFEFRLRTIQPAGDLEAGRRLLWSCVFPVKPGVAIPAEGFLHLPQKQKFTAHLFLKGKVIQLEKVAVSLDEHGGGRISLGDASTVTLGEPFTDWESFQSRDPAKALERIRAHRPGPFDLDVEIQEEVVLTDWQVGKPVERPADSQVVYPFASGTICFDAPVSQGEEGQALRAMLHVFHKKKRPPPLFGLMHYEKCRLILQPLAVFGKDGPEQLMLSNEKVDRKALLQALKF